MNPPSKKSKRGNQREKIKERKSKRENQREKNKERKNIFQNILITWKKNFYAVIFENSPTF